MSESRDSRDAKRRIVWRTLEAHRIPRDGVLLVHSAFKQLALDGFAADEVLDVLCAYMEPGTLLLPQAEGNVTGRLQGYGLQGSGVWLRYRLSFSLDGKPYH